MVLVKVVMRRVDGGVADEVTDLKDLMKWERRPHILIRSSSNAIDEVKR
jgi:hypothetical protein